MKCRLCSQTAKQIATRTILNHKDVPYYQCDNCDLIQTATPFWLDQAYSKAIASLDVGAMSRNMGAVGIVVFLYRCFANGQRLTGKDEGGGSGALVRLLRDKGLDFYWADRYCENIYANGFEASDDIAFDFVTAFEVAEHLVDVAGEMDRLFQAKPKLMLLGTLLHFGYNPAWWYFASETGQHVAFYSEKTMQFIAKKYGYRTVTTHRFTLFLREDVKTSNFALKLLRYLLCRPSLIARLGYLWAALRPMSSLAIADSVLISNRMSAQSKR